MRIDMSYGEKSAWVSLFSLGGAVAWYCYSHARSLLEGSLDFGDLLGAIVGLVVLIIVVEVSLHAILGLEGARKDDKRARVEVDERDALIDVRSDRVPYIILFTGAITAIWTAAVQSPIVTAHVILAFLAAAETTKVVTQLFYYRRGV